MCLGGVEKASSAYVTGCVAGETLYVRGTDYWLYSQLITQHTIQDRTI